MKSRTDLRVGNQKRDNETDQAINTIVYPHARSSNLFISSSDKVDGTYSNALYENTNKILKSDASQLAIKSVHFGDYCIPNTNGYNDQYNFLIQGEILEYNVTLEHINYITVQSFYDNLVIEMNNILTAGASLAVMSVNVVGCLAVLSSTIPFKFINSSGIDYGKSLHGLFYSEYTPELKAISNLQYTRYIDVLITELKSAEMGNTTFTEIHKFPSINHINRVFINETVEIPRTIKKEVINLDYITYRHRTLTSLQITLYDEYQKILYSEVQNIGADSFEIPYLKYEININIIS